MMPESSSIFVPNTNSPGASTAVAAEDPPTPSIPSEHPPEQAEATQDGSGVTFTTANLSNFMNSTISKSPELANVTQKLGTLKNSLVSTYKLKIHSVYEQLGKAERTVDTELEGRIEGLRELHKRYQEVLASSRAYAHFFAQSVNMQRNMAEALGQLANKEDSLKIELTHGGELMSSLHKNGEQALKALHQFVSSLECLASKTIEDTLLTIDRHEQARLEYDVARYEWNDLRKNPSAPPSTIDEAEKTCNRCLEKYQQLKEDVRVKLTLLEENRGKVMRKQLALVQRCFQAYFSESLETVNGRAISTHEQDDTVAEDNDDPMALPSKKVDQIARSARNPTAPHSSSFLEE